MLLGVLKYNGMLFAISIITTSHHSTYLFELMKGFDRVFQK